MLDGNNNWQRTNVYAAGKLVGTYDTLGLHFHLEDPLGTRRMQLSGNPNSVGQPETDIQSMPYGDQLNSYTDQYAPATADDATPLYFTGKERDAESGNDYFEARYYSSAMGRFMSPDWSAKEEPVPYAQLADPQSLNLYSYVRNNPLIRVDADGHDFIKDQNQQWIIDHQISNPDAGLMAAAGVHKLSGSNDDAPKDHFASVSDWSKSAGGFHHVGLAVDSDDTHGFSTNDPSTPGWKRIFGAPKARMEDDLDMHTKNGEVAPHSYMHIPITAGQAKAIQAAIDARRMSHP
jgi:RHS repeat-associated protein